MDESIISRMVQVGTVTDIDTNKKMARVKFQNADMTSGWLYVIHACPQIPGYDQPQRTEYASGGSGDSAFASHAHNLTIQPWMPKINDTVLVLYLPVFNGDGFILGGIG